MNSQHCDHLKEFLGLEKEIILRHIKAHKWFRHIGDYNEGVADFIENYGWLMRDMYCTSICQYRKECVISKQLLEESLDDVDNIADDGDEDKRMRA